MTAEELREIIEKAIENEKKEKQRTGGKMKSNNYKIEVLSDCDHGLHKSDGFVGVKIHILPPDELKTVSRSRETDNHFMQEWGLEDPSEVIELLEDCEEELYEAYWEYYNSQFKIVSVELSAEAKQKIKKEYIEAGLTPPEEFPTAKFAVRKKE